MEKPFAMSAVAFLFEVFGFLSGLLLTLRHVQGSAVQPRRRVLALTVVTTITAAVALLAPVRFLYEAPAALSTIHPAIMTIMALALLMPLVLVVAYGRWKARVGSGSRGVVV